MKLNCRCNLRPGVGEHRETCAKDLSLKNMEEINYLHFARDAVYAFAYALRLYHEDNCDGVPGLCAKLRNITGQELKPFLERIQFPGFYLPCKLA